jgi:hypothetical protein
MTTKKSDIYGNLTWILQKSSGFEGQFSLIDAFRAGFVRIFAAKICPSPGSRTERAYSVSTGKRQDNAVQIVWRAWGWKGRSRRSALNSRIVIWTSLTIFRPLRGLAAHGERIPC